MSLVSIIMPAYNASHFISRSIQCILDQNYDNFELIIICDAPTDNTVEIVKSFTDKRIRTFFLESNHGVSEARNLGLSQASGRYIAFCDADDFWYPEKLSIQIHLMQTQNLSICHSNCDLVNTAGNKIGQRIYPSIVTYKIMKYRNFICNSSGIYDAKKLSIVFQEKVYHEDYLMWLSLLSKAGKSVRSSQPLLMYTINPNGLSHNKIKSFLGMLKIQHLHGISLIECVFNLVPHIISRVFLYNMWKSK